MSLFHMWETEVWFALSWVTFLQVTAAALLSVSLSLSLSCLCFVLVCVLSVSCQTKRAAPLFCRVFVLSVSFCVCVLSLSCQRQESRTRATVVSCLCLVCVFVLSLSCLCLAKDKRVAPLFCRVFILSVSFCVCALSFSCPRQESRPTLLSCLCLVCVFLCFCLVFVLSKTRAARKASWNKAGVEPVHWYRPWLTQNWFSGTNPKCRFFSRTWYKFNKRGAWGSKTRLQEASRAESRHSFVLSLSCLCLSASLSCLCLVVVLSLFCLCLVFVLSKTRELDHSFVLSLSCLYVSLFWSCLCLVSDKRVAPLFCLIFVLSVSFLVCVLSVSCQTKRAAPLFCRVFVLSVSFCVFVLSLSCQRQESHTTLLSCLCLVCVFVLSFVSFVTCRTKTFLEPSGCRTHQWKPAGFNPGSLFVLQIENVFQFRVRPRCEKSHSGCPRTCQFPNFSAGR